MVPSASPSGLDQIADVTRLPLRACMAIWFGISALLWFLLIGIFY